MCTSAPTLPRSCASTAAAFLKVARVGGLVLARQQMGAAVGLAQFRIAADVQVTGQHAFLLAAGIGWVRKFFFRGGGHGRPVWEQSHSSN